MTDFRLRHLDFRGFPVDGRTSVAFAMPLRNRKGIYIYRFSDGTYYVGKSLNMVSRYTQHLHEYRHDTYLTDVKVVYAWFAVLPDNASGEELDGAETHVIAWMELNGYSLRNKLKTKFPQGAGDITIRLRDESGLSLPWDREDRTIYTLPSATLPAPTPRQRAQFNELEANPEYDGLVDVLSTYVSRTIAEPQATIGKLWCVSALPSTNQSYEPRLACITIARLETLVILVSRNRYGRIYMNMKRPENSRKKPRIGKRLWAGYEYASASGTSTFYYKDIEALSDALDDPRTLSWCWRLNVELMRQTTTPNVRGNNPLLAMDIIRRIHDYNAGRYHSRSTSSGN